MKRLPLLVLFILALLPCPQTAMGQERILSYDSFIKVKPAGDMEVTESIRVVCENGKIEHGIYRDFPTRYKDRYGNTVRVAFEVLEVLKNEKAEPWKTKETGNGVRVYIGSEDMALIPDAYTYTIRYRTDRQLGFFQNHDELYWNVTGNGWDFPIEQASATVELPQGAHAIFTIGYTGLKGQRGTDYIADRDREGHAVFSTTRPLGPQEGLTIVVTWPKGFVEEPTKTEKTMALFSDNLSPISGLAGIAVLLAYYFSAWLKAGRDPEKGVIIPLFEAPKGFSPGAVRYVVRMGFDDTSFAASIVNMAVKGFIAIEEDSGGDYTLTRKGGDGTQLSGEEKRISEELFGSRSTVALKKENHALIRKAMTGAEKSLAMEYEKIYFLTNSGTLVPGLLISILFIAAIVFLGRSRPDAGFMSLWLSLWTVGCAVLVFRAFNAWKTVFTVRTHEAGNFREAFILTLFALPFLGFEGFGLRILSNATSPVAVMIILLILLMNVIFYHLMKAPTIKGRKVMDQIEGLKLYLSVAEKDRLNELNPPEKTPEVFEKFLPYALALGVEQEWCEQFAHVLEKAGEESRYSPIWYSGRHFADHGATGLASSLGAMASSISSSSTAPGSKSGSGGSSGGGGGGGGGGGW